MIQVTEKNKCCGCAACLQKCPQKCISFIEDEEGFLYPKINFNECIDCNICNNVCPIINQGEKKLPKKIYASKSKNEFIRLNSSSGGLFTLLAEKIIEEGGVVFGARFNNNWEVTHNYTEQKDNLHTFRGSKYLQSKINNNYLQAEEYLKSNRKVLFTGTPCQIKGLKLYLKKEYDNLYTVDFLCHGVPSPKVWNGYLSELEEHLNINAKKDIDNIIFRNKKNGWQSYSFSISYYNNLNIRKEFSELFYDNIFMKGFLNDLYLRPSCYSCPSKSGKSNSDITIADYWSIDQVKPEFNDKKGVGLLLINSIKGETFFPFECTDYIETSYEDAKGLNGGFKESIKIPSKRKYFFAHLDSTPQVSRLIEKSIIPSIGERIKRKLISFIYKPKS